jgi:hypothetical protein
MVKMSVLEIFFIPEYILPVIASGGYMVKCIGVFYS